MSAAVLLAPILTLALLATAAALGFSLSPQRPSLARSEAWCFAVSIGLGILASMLWLLAVAGWLSPLWVGLLAVTLHTACRRGWAIMIEDLRVLAVHLRETRILGWAIAGVILLAPWLLLASYPPIGFDAGTYHYPLAEALATHHRLAFASALRFPNFPLLSETLFSSFFFFHATIGPQLLEVALAAMTALMIWHWVRGGGSASSAWFAAALFVGCPAVILFSAEAYIDAGLALFVTCSLAAYGRYRRSNDLAWLRAAGLEMGFAAGCKYHGLALLALLALVVLWSALRNLRARPLWEFAWTAGLGVAPWYFVLTFGLSNPVFPFLGGIFGPSAWSPPMTFAHLNYSSPGRLLTVVSGKTAGLWRLLTTWVSSPRRAAGDLLTPLQLALLPLPLLAAFSLRRSRWLVLVTGGYLAGWILIGANPRYLLPVLPALSFFGGHIAARLQEHFAIHHLASRWKKGLTALTVIALLPSMATALVRVWSLGPPPMSPAGRTAFLEHQVRGYAALRWLARNDPKSTVYALYGERLHAYAGTITLLGEWIGPYRYAPARHYLRDVKHLFKLLSTWNANYFLLMGDRLPSEDVARELLRSPHFELAWQRGKVMLFRLRR